VEAGDCELVCVGVAAEVREVVGTAVCDVDAVLLGVCVVVAVFEGVWEGVVRVV